MRTFRYTLNHQPALESKDDLMAIHSTATPTDRARAIRLLISWGSGDKLGVDVVLAETSAAPIDSNAASGLLFGVLDTAIGLAEQLDPEIREAIDAALHQALLNLGQ